MRRAAVATLALALFAASSIAGCATDTEEEQPTVAEVEAGLPELDDDKADIFGINFDGIRRYIRDLIQNFSATTDARFYRTPEEALAEIERKVRDRGIADPRNATYVGYISTMPIVLDWDHSEFMIDFATFGSTTAWLSLRTVGDPNGAGVFADQGITSKAGPRMCMTWSMLEAAVRASYMSGIYGINFVCHNSANKVLRALGAGPEYFRGKIGGWKIAGWAYGSWGSSGLPRDPASWPTTAVCKRTGLAE